MYVSYISTSLFNEEVEYLNVTYPVTCILAYLTFCISYSAVSLKLKFALQKISDILCRIFLFWLVATILVLGH